MNIRRLMLLIAGFAKSPLQSAHAISSARGFPSLRMDEHLRLSASWLLTAQRNCPDGDGYSRRFSLAVGWDRGYVETTGYIIPTLLNVGDFLGDETLRQSALKAGEWLLAVQEDNGSFAEIDQGQPMVFDTGQVILGLNRLWRETKDERFLHASRRAGTWLCEVQDDDGAWRSHAYNDEPHSYYSRVGAALAEIGMLAEEDWFVEAGRRNLDWTLGQERPDGWFEHCAFHSSDPALLHTMVYVLEGLYMGGEILGDKRYTESALRGAQALLGRCNAGELPYARYYSDWRIADNEYCVTGLAQFAGICFEMGRISGDEGFLTKGKYILDSLCAWQCREGNDVKGALPSSVPLWGKYGCMAFYNWNNKFFLDAVYKYIQQDSDFESQPLIEE